MDEITGEWAARHMTRTAAAIARLPDMTGVRLAMSMHLDMKMVPLVRGLLARGAALYVTTCNPATVRDDVVRAMRDAGADVHAQHGMTPVHLTAAIAGGLDWGPTHLCEMGADFTHHALTTGRATTGIRAGLEATGSGIARLEGAAPPWPVFNWDDLPVKEGLHNRHMVGLTTWTALLSRTLLSLHEKRVLVIGYGSVGRGLAASARAFGGLVSVAEADPARRIEARYDGWEAGDVASLAPRADVIVTATGARHVLSFGVIKALRDGCLILNSGHRADEIELGPLRDLPATHPLPTVETFRRTDGQEVHLFAGGEMANLTAGEGDSLNAFDVTLAVMAAGIGHIVGAGETAPPGVHLLPRDVWQRACTPSSVE